MALKESSDEEKVNHNDTVNESAMMVDHDGDEGVTAAAVGVVASAVVTAEGADAMMIDDAVNNTTTNNKHQKEDLTATQIDGDVDVVLPTTNKGEATTTSTTGATTSTTSNATSASSTGASSTDADVADSLDDNGSVSTKPISPAAILAAPSTTTSSATKAAAAPSTKPFSRLNKASAHKPAADDDDDELDFENEPVSINTIKRSTMRRSGDPPCLILLICTS